MCQLREFDIRCRGTAELAEDWRKNHHQVRKVWKAEELLAKCNQCAHDAIELYKNFRLNPDSEYPFSIFVSLLDGLVRQFHGLVEAISVLEDEGYPVEGLNDLRTAIEALEEIIHEDRFATDAALGGGIIDGWE